MKHPPLDSAGAVMVDKSRALFTIAPMNENAQALGRLAKGKPKTLTEAQRKASADRMRAAQTQPLLVLHRDTVRSFLHEKLSLLVSESRLLAYIGIEASLISALATATFSDLWAFKASLIQGTFSAFSIIIGLLLIREAWRWWHDARGLTPTTLTDELSQRGALILPKANNDGEVAVSSSTPLIQSEKPPTKLGEQGADGNPH